MMDFSAIDNSIINKIALVLGGAFVFILIIALILGKLLLLLRLPRGLVQRVVSVLASLGFIYLIVILGDRFF
ncbi:hypothetical protein CWS01_07125 [Niallia nealsonii]|uniref:Uncharacterized protein n=1 Tax=Niallia nealsonii TaxID=115979 RepID=A0A2N0Z4E1_9BACI|nr:hypothetical protein CWS01_07125 [Niallia nealsonii]